MNRTPSRLNLLSAWIYGPAGIPAQLAYRLTHPRRRRKVVSLDWQRAASYEELLVSRWPSILCVRESARLRENDELLFAELATDEIVATHFRSEMHSTAIGLGCLHNVLVSGQSLVGRSWLLYRLAPFTPLFVDEYLSDGLPVGDRKITHKRKLSIPNVTVLVTHWNSGTYGHWLLEGMPKLLLLRQLAQQLPPLRIALPASLGVWVKAWIERILPSAAIATYDDRSSYLQCHALLLPSLLSDPEHHLFHPELASLVEDLQPAAPEGSRRSKLYVSRGRPSLFRQLSNQGELEAIAASEGLEVVNPETLTIAEQMQLFARAEIVVGEFGSAMHNCLFSPPGTKVLCLNWINGLQSRIAQLKQHRVGYLLPSNGAPVKYVEGASSQSYHIDPQQFRRCLKALMSG